MRPELDVFDVVFQPNKTKKNLILPIILISFFILISLLILLAGIGASLEEGNNDLLWTGIGMTIFSVGIMILLVFFTAARGVSYVIGNKRILLIKKNNFIEISYSDIEDLKHYTDDESDSFYKEKVLTVMRQQMSMVSNFDFSKLKEAFSLQKESEKMYSFLSVPRSQSSSERTRFRTNEEYELNFKADIPCSTVYIKLKTGEEFLISPKDSIGFFDEAKKHFSKSQHRY